MVRPLDSFHENKYSALANQRPDLSVYIGRGGGDTLIYHLGPLKKDLLSKKSESTCEASPLYWQLYFPEINDELYSYEDNRAFIAGAIQCNREFRLITDIAQVEYKSGFVDELFWLEDNGYVFDVSPVTPFEAAYYEHVSRFQIIARRNTDGLNALRNYRDKRNQLK